MLKEKDSVFNYINENKIDFLAYGITPLHAIGIDATINKFFVDKAALNGCILIGSHPITGTCLDEDSFNIKHKGITFFREDIPSIIHPVIDRVRAFRIAGAREKDSYLYIISSEIQYEWLLMASKQFKNSNIIYVLIDDGGGSYTNQYKDCLRIELNSNGIYQFGIKYLKTSIKFYLRTKYSVLLKKYLTSKGRFVDHRIFIYNSTGFHRNTSICDYYFQQFLYRGQKKHKNSWDIFEHSVLINTQCLEENGITNGEVDLNIYKTVINILKDFNEKIVLKTHPREQNLTKYNELLSDNLMIFSDSSVSQEIILSVCKQPPKCILSIFSSTLLNAKGLFDIPVISLAKIALTYQIRDIFKEQLEDFIIQYDGLFEFPNNYNELKDYLCEILYDN